MDGINKNDSDMFNKIKRLMSILCSFIAFITVYSIMDIVSFYYSGCPLRASTLMLVAVVAVLSISFWLAIYNRIERLERKLNEGKE